ncbi:MAG: ABC transporter permease subunit [Propionibacteriales bacterium]|nr:ABC transporter permease subunit [Propionibacteriales bacterium]
MTLLAADDSAACYSLVENRWICGSYLSDYRSEIVDATVQHVWITLVAVTIGLLIAVPLAVFARSHLSVEASVLGSTTILYTIPSLAMFAILLPFTGISVSAVIIGLVLYSLSILVRNTIAGLRAVPADAVESALGLGYGRAGLLLKIELPLALPVIMAGLRVATVSTVALTTVGAILGFGGLGNLLYDGVQKDFKAQVLVASVLCVALAVVFDVLLVAVQRMLTPWARART